MLTWTPLSAAAYADARYRLLAAVEGMEPRPYRDSVGLVTIGIGFNINAPEDRLQGPVFDALGLASGSPGRADLAALFASGVDGTALTEGADAIVAKAVGRADAACVLSAARCQALLEEAAAAYEAQVDAWLPGIPQSRERLALVSLAWNGILVNSPSLRRGLQGGDRAEAWVQIRFNSNGGASRSRGIAKRRGLEGSLVGLYADAAALTVAEAGAVLAAVARHQTIIDTAEATYPGVAKLANDAYVDVVALLPDGRVPTLDEALAPARRAVAGAAIG